MVDSFNTNPGIERYQEREQKEASCKTNIPDGGIRRKRMKLLKNRTVLGILCIVLSLAICFLATPLFNQAISQKTDIVRVQKAIKAGD